MREVANEMKVATQMGNQGTADSGFRAAIEIIRSGAIGPVKEVHVWTNRPIWPQGEGRPNRSDPVPEHVHWDLFLGPAPERPYVASVYTPRSNGAAGSISAPALWAIWPAIQRIWRSCRWSCSIRLPST